MLGTNQQHAEMTPMKTNQQQADRTHIWQSIPVRQESLEQSTADRQETYETITCRQAEPQQPSNRHALRIWNMNSRPTWKQYGNQLKFDITILKHQVHANKKIMADNRKHYEHTGSMHQGTYINKNNSGETTYVWTIDSMRTWRPWQIKHPDTHGHQRRHHKYLCMRTQYIFTAPSQPHHLSWGHTRIWTRDLLICSQPL